MYLKHYIKAKSRKYIETLLEKVPTDFQGEKLRKDAANLDEHLPPSRRSLYSAINVVELQHVVFPSPCADIWEAHDLFGFENF